MKRLILLIALVFPLGTVLSCSGGTGEPAASETPAAEPAPAQNDQEIETTIVGLEQEWVSAIVDKDTATIDRLMADNFVGTSPTGAYYMKDQVLDDLRSGRLDVTSMSLDESSANIFGDTAVAFTSQNEVSTYAGEDTSGHYHYTDVWLRRNGQWQVVASHGSRDVSGE